MSIATETNLVEIDFLHVTFNLSTGKYYSHNKPNNILLYINKKSNHSRSAVKQLPKMINKRTLDMPCDENEFANTKVIYKSALKQWFNSTMKFDQQPSTKRNSNRKIDRFNLLFFKYVHKNFQKIINSEK